MSVGREEIRNRFGFHPGTSTTIPQHERVREAFISFAEFLDKVLPDSEAKLNSLTNLQMASMWANFSIAEQAPLEKKRRYNIITRNDSTSNP